MIARQQILDILKSYDPQNITIGVIGGHSALDVCQGAKKYGFRTVAVCQKGREQTYQKYYRTRPDVDVVPGQFEAWRADKGCIDEVIVVDKFADIVKPEVQEQLRALNTIFIHNRYFWVYCNFEEIQQDFLVPILGSRGMVKLEERDVPNNQYDLLAKANIRFPKIYQKPEDINTMVMVKVNEAERSYERAFFAVSSESEYQDKIDEMLKSGKINEEGLSKAVIEEFVVGAHVNFNYFYSPIDDELEFMGTDTRRQTNLDGFLRMTADRQAQALQHIAPTMIETGHIACTIKESLLEKAFELGERFVRTTHDELSTGIIGPFALQGAVVSEEGREEIVIFDVSMRIPGSPGTRFTPYSGYLYGTSLSYGERIAMEVKKAMKRGKLAELVT